MDNFLDKNNDIINFDDQDEGKEINGIQKVEKPIPTIDSLMGQCKKGYYFETENHFRQFTQPYYIPIVECS